MARTTLVFDSATPAQIYNLTLAFQRTSGLLRDEGFGGHVVPPQVTDKPVVSVAGSAMSWRSPALTVQHSAALLAEYDRLERGGPTEDAAR